jgi:hypothetical protein
VRHCWLVQQCERGTDVEIAGWFGQVRQAQPDVRLLSIVCHWLCQCRVSVIPFALAEPVAHVFVQTVRQAPSAATTFFAASVRSVALMIGRPLFASIARPSSTSVPSSRTTSGTLKPTFS